MTVRCALGLGLAMLGQAVFSQAAVTGLLSTNPKSVAIYCPLYLSLRLRSVVAFAGRARSGCVQLDTKLRGFVVTK